MSAGRNRNSSEVPHSQERVRRFAPDTDAGARRAHQNAQWSLLDIKQLYPEFTSLVEERALAALKTTLGQEAVGAQQSVQASVGMETGPAEGVPGSPNGATRREADAGLLTQMLKPIEFPSPDQHQLGGR